MTSIIEAREDYLDRPISWIEWHTARETLAMRYGLLSLLSPANLYPDYPPLPPVIAEQVLIEIYQERQRDIIKNNGYI